MFRFLGFLILGSLIFHTPLSAQEKGEKPKIVIGLVVDQMRQEYLFKYQERYGEGGFRRLMRGGYMMKNAHINYIPSYTGPGHASLYTGTTPSNHGIIGNDWYLRDEDNTIYCVEDKSRSNVAGSEKNGSRSPIHLQTTTITDELKLSTNHRSKVISIALKDRAAILPAGHLGDAYWYDGLTGEFMTSDYYKKVAPLWLLDFNKRELPRRYLDQIWETLYPIESYIQSVNDANDYEEGFVGKETPDFPYDLQALRKNNKDLELLPYTPFGISLTFDMAYAAIHGENLGQGKETDFLAISITPTDYIGHNFGPSSVEIEDTYLRLDRDIEIFLDSLDSFYGRGEYLLFLSSDHGVAELAEYMQEQRIPSDKIARHDLKADLKAFASEHYDRPFRYGNFIVTGLLLLMATSFAMYLTLKIKRPTSRYLGVVIVLAIFGGLSALYLNNAYHDYKGRKKSWIGEVINEQIFLNRSLIKEKGLDIRLVRNDIAEFAKNLPGIKEVFTSEQISKENYTSGTGLSLKNGFMEELSGDILLVLKPSWVPKHGKGTTHGSGYTYDTHIPIVFYGWNIGHGESEAYCTITDIAPTLSMMLNIKFPSGSTGSPLVFNNLN